MTYSLGAALLWFVAANVIGVIPSRRHHWPQAYVLISIGVPILIWVWVENGPLIALLCLAGAISILRWPVRYLFRWLRSLLARSG
jgi:hypothetical protein